MSEAGDSPSLRAEVSASVVMKCFRRKPPEVDYTPRRSGAPKRRPRWTEHWLPHRHRRATERSSMVPPMPEKLAQVRWQLTEERLPLPGRMKTACGKKKMMMSYCGRNSWCDLPFRSAPNPDDSFHHHRTDTGCVSCHALPGFSIYRLIVTPLYKNSSSHTRVRRGSRALKIQQPGMSEAKASDKL